MGLRQIARQIRAGRRKAALALEYAAYVEQENAAGRVAIGKRAWRLALEKNSLRVASE